jgi:predicted site-specific integrase-resolvase
MEAPEAARKLGVSDRTLRAWLRATYPRKAIQRFSKWDLNKAMFAEAKAHFSAKSR